MDAVKLLKNTIRKEIKYKLKSLSNEQKHKQSNVVIEKLYKLPEFKESLRVSVYLSTEEEVNTEPIVRYLIENGKKCFIPRYNGSTMEMIKLVSMKDYEDLPLTKWKIKQPLTSEKRENAIETGGLDLIIVPGVAFTKDGVRLGHGKGYYDTFLTKCIQSQNEPPKTIALAFNEQIVDQIPTHDHDIKIDQVLAPNIYQNS